MPRTRRLSPERERARARVFDLAILPLLILITAFLVWKAFTG